MFVTVLLGFIQALLLLLLTPLFTGISRKIRARIQTRKGAPILQDYYDLAKLFARQEMSTKNSGPIFRWMPAIYLGSYFAVAMGLPLLTANSPIPFLADVITVIYLLAVPRFFFALASIDSSSSFAGVGGVRELIVSTLVEPGMMLALIVVALLAQTTSISEISLMNLSGNIPAIMAFVVAGIAFAYCTYIELGKLPYDLAEAEQELQEGPLTEYSGASLAFLKLGMGLKQLVMLGLFISIFLPFGASIDASFASVVLAAIILIIKILVIFFLVGLIENAVARVRFANASHQIWVSLGIACLAFVFFIVGI